MVGYYCSLILLKPFISPGSPPGFFSPWRRAPGTGGNPAAQARRAPGGRQKRGGRFCRTKQSPVLHYNTTKNTFFDFFGLAVKKNHTNLDPDRKLEVPCCSCISGYVPLR
jgi:hypothetical protein